MTKRELFEALSGYPDDIPVITREWGETSTLIYVDVVDPVDAHVILGIAYDCQGECCPFCQNPPSTIRSLPILVFD